MGNVVHESLASIGPAIRTNTTIAAPSNIADGDILLYILGVQDNSLIAVTPPSGFAAAGGSVGGILIDVDPADGGTGEMQLYALWKRAAAESGSYTATHAAAFTEGVLIRYSGAKASGDPTTNPNATGAQGLDSSTHTATGATTAVNGTMAVFVDMTWDDENALTPPSGSTPTFTERYDPGAANNTLYVADGPMTTAGATGNKSVTGAIATNGWAACLIFIEAAVAAGGAVVAPMPYYRTVQLDS